MSAFLKFLGSRVLSTLYFVPQPNWALHTDVNLA